MQYSKRMYWVYLLKCGDGSFYTGYTNNIKRRIKEHTNRKNTKSYTARHEPIRLVYFELFTTKEEAQNREKEIKSKDHKYKEELALKEAQG